MKYTNSVFCILHVIPFLSCSDTVCKRNSSQICSEIKIRDVIFKDYSKFVLPKYNRSDPITIGVAMVLRAVDEIDVKTQTLVLRLAIGFFWTDELLKWNPKDFEDIRSVFVSENDVWRPTLQLLDSPEYFHGNIMDERLLEVSNDGDIERWTIESYKVPCKLDISKYPFDQQICHMHFESWYYSTRFLIFKTQMIHADVTGYYQRNSEWNLIETNMSFYDTWYEEEVFGRIKFTIHVERKYLYQILYTAIPVACTSFLSITSFILPSDHGERISLSVSLFLALAVLMTLVKNDLPETSDHVSFFGTYVGLQLIWSGLTVFMTSISTKIFYKSRHENETTQRCKLLLFFAGMVMCQTRKQTKSGEFLSKTSDETKDEFGSDNIESSNSELEKDTWKTISIALDRLCLILTLLWHITLNLTTVLVLLY